MGLFLTLAGVAGSTTQQIQTKLAEFAAKRGMKMQPNATTPGDDGGFLVLCPGQYGHTILWGWQGPGQVEELSEYLSRQLRKPVLWMHIHDGDFWMYQLFADGVIVDSFNPIPKYWNDNLPDEEVRKWCGDAEIFTKHWPGVKAESISRYLTEWNFSVKELVKAYPDDTFPPRCDLQLLDFMRKLGLDYPINGFDAPVRGIPSPAVRQKSPETAKAKNITFKGQTFSFA